VEGVDIGHDLSNQRGRRRTLFDFNDANILISIRDFIQQRSTDLESWSVELQIQVGDSRYERMSNRLRNFLEIRRPEFDNWTFELQSQLPDAPFEVYPNIPTEPPTAEDLRIVETCSGLCNGHRCKICSEEYLEREPSILQDCGHVFCKECITRALNRSRRCPVCKKKALKRHILPIFF